MMEEKKNSENSRPNLSIETLGVQIIRRWTIRRGQFGKKYNINFIENRAFTQRYSFSIPPPFQQFFLSIPLLFQQYFSSILLTFHQYSFQQSRFHFSNILLIKSASISAIFFWPIPLPFQQNFSSIPLPFKQSSSHQSRFHICNFLAIQLPIQQDFFLNS